MSWFAFDRNVLASEMKAKAVQSPTAPEEANPIMANALRVLHHLSLSSRNWGGVQAQFKNFVTATRADPRISNYLSVDHRALPIGFPAISEQLSKAPFNYRQRHGIPLPNLFRPAYEAHWAQRQRISVVVNTNFFGNLRSARVARKSGAAAVYWERGAAWFPRKKPLSSLFGVAHDLIIANSHASRRMLQDMWGIEGRIEVCQPCVWQTDLQSLAETKHLSTDRPVRIGFAARLRGFKGGILAVHTLRELAARGFDAVLVVAGDGSDRAFMEAVAQKLAVQDKIEWLGHVDDMQGFYRDIDLLLHPALREPYGNVCAEAALAGLPVVATMVDGLSEVVEDGVTGYTIAPTLPLSDFRGLGGDRSDLYAQVYRPELGKVGEPALPDPATLARAVLRIAGTKKSYGTMSRSAARAAKCRFLPEQHIDRFIELIRIASTQFE